MTITIQAGNTDNKLTQQQWAEYVSALDKVITEWADEVHFMGGPANWMPWQNVCWVVNVDAEERVGDLRMAVIMVREHFKQDGIAWTEGTTEVA